MAPEVFWVRDVIVDIWRREALVVSDEPALVLIWFAFAVEWRRRVRILAIIALIRAHRSDGVDTVSIVRPVVDIDVGSTRIGPCLEVLGIDTVTKIRHLIVAVWI